MTLLLNRLTLYSSRYSKSASMFCKDFNLEYQAWTNLVHIARFFGRSIFLARPIGHAKNRLAKSKCPSDRKTSGNIAFCSLLPKQDSDLHLGFCCPRQLTNCCLNVSNKMTVKEQFSYFRNIDLKMFRRICCKNRALLKVSFTIDASIIIYRYFTAQMFLRMPPYRYL